MKKYPHLFKQVRKYFLVKVNVQSSVQIKIQLQDTHQSQNSISEVDIIMMNEIGAYSS